MTITGFYRNLRLTCLAKETIKMNYARKINIDESSICFANHSNNETLSEIREILEKSVLKTGRVSSAYLTNNYHKELREVQDILNKKNFVNKIVQSIKGQIKEYIQHEFFLVQTNLYLRGTRPNNNFLEETIGWHRESFYGSDLGASVNIWTPIMNVTPENTLRYIPNSQYIDDSQILTSSIESKLTAKGSDRNKVGLLYSPKQIIQGVDLTNSRPMIVPENSSAIFSGNLIHGAAKNNTPKIRFSVDFRIMDKRSYKPEKSKSFHEASGKAYFEEFN